MPTQMVLCLSVTRLISCVLHCCKPERSQYQLLTCTLADDGTLLERVVDALDAVTLAADEEAAAQLGARCAGVEQCGGGVGEPALTAS